MITSYHAYHPDNECTQTSNCIAWKKAHARHIAGSVASSKGPLLLLMLAHNLRLQSFQISTRFVQYPVQSFERQQPRHWEVTTVSSVPSYPKWLQINSKYICHLAKTLIPVASAIKNLYKFVFFSTRMFSLPDSLTFSKWKPTKPQMPTNQPFRYTAKNTDNLQHQKRLQLTWFTLNTF